MTFVNFRSAFVGVASALATAYRQVQADAVRTALPNRSHIDYL
jgi:hypothetical protein